MKVLHIIPDDKFWRCPIDVFSPLDVDNEYICFVWNKEAAFQYIQSDIISRVNISDSVSLWNRDDVDVFMFHSFPPYTYEMIASVPNDKIAIVSSWGYDIYTSIYGVTPILDIDIYKKHTRKFIERSINGSVLRCVLRKVKHVLLYKDYKQKSKIKSERVAKLKDMQLKAVKRADYWATVLPSEYELLKKIEGFKAKYFPFQYSSKDTDQILELCDFDNATDILLGNSADPTNNHTDVIKIIQKRNIRNRIFMPLSYGNNGYAEYVESFLKIENLNAFVQKDFLPYQEYVTKLKSCRVGIFGHIRQQAIGNIHVCFLRGCKVFLYKDSIAYQYYKSQGFYVYSIEDELWQNEIDTPLTKEQMETNIRKLDRFSLESVQRNLAIFLKEMFA